jgi:hypothetical protein
LAIAAQGCYSENKGKPQLFNPQRIFKCFDKDRF